MISIQYGPDRAWSAPWSSLRQRASGVVLCALGAQAARVSWRGGYHCRRTVRIGEGSCEVCRVKRFRDTCDIWFASHRALPWETASEGTVAVPHALLTLPEEAVAGSSGVSFRNEIFLVSFSADDGLRSRVIRLVNRRRLTANQGCRLGTRYFFFFFH